MVPPVVAGTIKAKRLFFPTNESQVVESFKGAKERSGYPATAKLFQMLVRKAWERMTRSKGKI
jgi:hypothetical protein